MPEANLYELLQVQPTADSEIIQAAYRRLILRYHPDRNPGADAQEITQRLNRAFEILTDPESRAAYDRGFSARTGNYPTDDNNPLDVRGGFVESSALLPAGSFRPWPKNYAAG